MLVCVRECACVRERERLKEEYRWVFNRDCERGFSVRVRVCVCVREREREEGSIVSSHFRRVYNSVGAGEWNFRNRRSRQETTER